MQPILKPELLSALSVSHIKRISLSQSQTRPKKQIIFIQISETLLDNPHDPQAHQSVTKFAIRRSIVVIYHLKLI